MNSPNPVLVVAHPGHELRIHHWLERFKPIVHVLTDGSAASAGSRLSSTEKVLSQAGARGGSVFGAFTDREVYRLLLERDAKPLLPFVASLVNSMVQENASVVVSDAVEGFNPSHDLCFVIAAKAAALAEELMDCRLRHLTFPLESVPTAAFSETDLEKTDQGAVAIKLDSAAYKRKMVAASLYGPLLEEVERNISDHGASAFAIEVLSPAVSAKAAWNALERPPHYETHGEARVAEGVYEYVVRFEEHFLPLVQQIIDWSPSPSEFS